MLDRSLPWIPKGPGRPRKNVSGRNVLEVTLAERGLTRRQALRQRRLAEIPEAEFERILALPTIQQINAAVRRAIYGSDRRDTVHLPRLEDDPEGRRAKIKALAAEMDRWDLWQRELARWAGDEG